MTQTTEISVSRADNRQVVDACTKYTDSLLDELAQLASEENVNFNNTNQFAKLLFHLENTLLEPVFCSVPSEIILQLLFTLTARCPQSNWSHDSSHGYVGNTSEYLRSINQEYDNWVFKHSLQDRSRQILHSYAVLVYGSADSLAIQTLKANLSAVLGTFLRTGITSLFLRHKPDVEDYFRVRKSQNDIAESQEYSQSQGDANPEISGGDVAPTAVEVISDSDDAEGAMDESMSPEIALKMYSPDMPYKSVASLSELTSKASGMGEAAALFQNMPHLQATSESDPTTEQKSDSIATSESPPKPSDPRKKMDRISEKKFSPLDSEPSSFSADRKDKKQKTLDPPWKRIQAYDDFMISKKLSNSTNYDLWNLLEWTLVCADTSSEYQKFLFNSSSTNVHNIYRANGDFLTLFFTFCHSDLMECAANGRSRASIVARLISGLGARNVWHERTVTKAFAGLGVRYKNPPHPCYQREAMLTNNDPVVQNSRCKTECANDDNEHSMALRVQLLFLLVHYETITLLSQAQPVVKREESLSSLVNEGLSSLVLQVVRNLSRLSLVHVEMFLNTLEMELSSDIAKVVGSTLSSTSSSTMRLADLDTQICIGLLGEVTGINYIIDPGTFESQVEDILVDPQTYYSIVSNRRFKSVEDLFCQWEKLMFLLERLFYRSLRETAQHELKYGGVASRFTTILSKAQRADELASQGYAECIEGRYVHSDVMCETAFTLTRAEVDKWMALRRCVFHHMAKWQLGIR
ncbi:hypothetical protein JCM33374_g648 [Metschnikowia sp. JCM 33374]|nr:hypothetical protein JCM33374_g648 [Metschnikowia sp. JCM 33374]